MDRKLTHGLCQYDKPAVYVCVYMCMLYLFHLVMNLIARVFYSTMKQIEMDVHVCCSDKANWRHTPTQTQFK